MPSYLKFKKTIVGKYLMKIKRQEQETINYYLLDDYEMKDRCLVVGKRIRYAWNEKCGLHYIPK